MHITQLRLQNFRGFSDKCIPFDTQFNLIVGDNSSGKTAILEALAVALGSFFLGLRGVEARHIRREDIHWKDNALQFPVRIEAQGILQNNAFTWARQRNHAQGQTSTKETQTLQTFAQSLYNCLQTKSTVQLPLIAYYATNRLFVDARPRVTEKQRKARQLSPRLEAYQNCLESKSTFSQFVAWFREATQPETPPSPLVECITELLIAQVPHCTAMYYEFETSAHQGLKIELADGRILPFHLLSDGLRNFLALLADIAFKACTLNPHLHTDALRLTQGVVLIDELDLHLHPAWQKQLLYALQQHFPKIQFFATTHSPFLIQEMRPGQLHILEPDHLRRAGGSNQSLEDIAEQVQGIPNPQWSRKREQILKLAAEYYQALQQNTVTPELQQAMDTLNGQYSEYAALRAILQQEAILQQKK